jgi:hypothetical protein
VTRVGRGLAVVVLLALPVVVLLAVVTWSGDEDGPADELDAESLVGEWRDASGDEVADDELVVYAGSSHCGWQFVLFLQLGDRQFVRDPLGQLAGFPGLGQLDRDAELPTDAEDTGYRRDGVELWLTDTAAFLRDGETVESWPGVADPIGCA